VRSKAQTRCTRRWRTSASATAAARYPGARGLVATLLVDGSPDALEAAKTIGHALDNEAALVALSPEERTAIFCVLEDPPEGLVELRGVLANDVSYRHGM